MKLYTFQPVAAYEAAKKRGYLTATEELAKEAWNEGVDADFWDWVKPSYDFMLKQMAKRLPNFTGEYPIWAYAWRVDLRCFRREYKSEQLLMTLDVPEERVLLSCMDGWHFVMNNSYFAVSEKEYNRVCGEDGGRKVSKKVREKSWERIFDLDLEYAPDWMGTGPKDLQACCDRVYLDEIKSIRQLRPWGKGQCK